ncbi:hypothetical protein [Streptomyces sp. NBC_00996]|uniref:hypothetical protein n=1 Tax=Streptomyces sp. NBC_00996 TaxID=2903710 RepID=UPI0038649DDD
MPSTLVPAARDAGWISPSHDPRRGPRTDLVRPRSPARGATAITNDSKITDIVPHTIEGVAEGTSSSVFANIVCVVNLPPAFPVPSTHAHDKYLPFIWPLLAILSLLLCCSAGSWRWGAAMA